MNYTPEQIEEWKKKAEKWDKLYKKVEACYFDEEGNEVEGDGGLDVIGEHCAIAMGFL